MLISFSMPGCRLRRENYELQKKLRPQFTRNCRNDVIADPYFSDEWDALKNEARKHSGEKPMNILRECLDVSRDLTKEETDAAIRIALAAVPPGSIDAVPPQDLAVSPHPDPLYAPRSNRCVYNAMRVPNSSLAGAYRVYVAFINGRIARVELVAHVLNVLPDGRWFDTTPADDAPRVTKVLTFMETTGSVLAKFGEFIAKHFEANTGLKIPACVKPFDMLVPATLRVMGMQVRDDGELAMTQLGAPDRAAIARLPPCASPTLIVYVGPGTSAALAPKMRKSDDISVVKYGRIDLSLRDVLAESRCCWRCSKAEAAKTCSRCKVARYCDAECQAADWRAGHKGECVQLQ